MILIYMEGFVHTKSDLKHVEQELTDYDDLHGLVTIIKNVFRRMTDKIDKQLDKGGCVSLSEPSEEEYNRLEKMVQKYEQDIRNHIKVYGR